MKTKLTLFVAVIAVALVGTGCSSLDKGLLAYYPFNGNALDESGNGQNGQLKGVSLVVDRHGENNAAYSFLPRNNSYIEVPESENLPWVNMQTISVWLKMRVENSPEKGANVVIRNYQDNAGSLSGWSLHLLNLNDDGSTFIEWICGGRGSFRMLCPIKRGDWFNITVQNKADTFEVYINGVLKKSQQMPPSRKRPNKVSLLIGGWTQTKLGGEGSFNGEIDDVRIYNRALSAEEVKALYDLEKPKAK